MPDKIELCEECEESPVVDYDLCQRCLNHAVKNEEPQIQDYPSEPDLWDSNPEAMRLRLHG